MSQSAFTTTPEDILPVLAELAPREPIFHRPAFASTSDDFARLMDPSYWEVGASGRRYSAAFILAHVEANQPGDADALGWQTSDFSCRHLGPDTYLLTYTLAQGDRLTRRATLWQRVANDWRILYHQGTLIETTNDITLSEGAGYTPRSPDTTEAPLEAPLRDE